MISSGPNPVTYFAQTNWRNELKRFGIKQADRFFHMHLIGQTGTGKTTMLETMIRQDIARGFGCCLIDPHGDLVEKLVAEFPKDRLPDLVYFNAPNRANPIAYNPLDRVPPGKLSLAVSGLLDVFRKLWPDFWGPRLEHILRNALLLLFDQPESTLADVLRLFDDKAYRAQAAQRSPNAQLRRFWLKEYEGYPARLRAEAIAPIQNKVGAFVTDPLLARILTAPRSGFSIREVMDDGKVLLVNLAKGKIGETNAALLGALLLSGLQVAAHSRAEMVEADRRDFIVYLDEFPTFATNALGSMLSELRKYRVGLVLAHQFLSQLDPLLRDAVLGNVGTLVAFRVGLPDAEYLAKEFFPTFSPLDLVNLPNWEVYLRLVIEGKVSQGFSGKVGSNGSGGSSSHP